MNLEQHILLTDEQWWTVESIADAFAQSSSFNEALLTGMRLLLKTMRRDGAAVLMPGPILGSAPALVSYQAPASWPEAIYDSASQISQIARQVFETGTPAPGLTSLGMAAALPIRLDRRVDAVLLVSGEPVRAEEYPRWLALLRPFARAFAQQKKGSAVSPAYPEVLRSRNTLRAMFDSLPLSIYIINEQYELAAINYSRAGRANSAPRALVGRRCFEALYDRSAPCPGCRVMETLTTGEITMRMNRTGAESGASLQWEMNTFPIVDENDRPIQAIVVEQDVTEKRNLEANLIQSEKLAAVGQLAAGVAHEINNPLTAIIANAQLLLREISPKDEEMWDSLKLIEMAGTRASQVVRNLLGIARKEKYEFDLVDINETVQNALALVQHELAGRPIRMELNLDEHMPPVLASQDQLQGVWINLILNAIDAIDKSQGVITIESRYTGNEFLVTIADNGKGITGEHLPRVFEPFFTTKSVGRGTGLGLSVCLRAIRHHGGNIQVESMPGEGTRFIVSLPEQRDAA